MIEFGAIGPFLLDSDRLCEKPYTKAMDNRMRESSSFFMIRKF
jgi:hypothetical protein